MSKVLFGDRRLCNNSGDGRDGFGSGYPDSSGHGNGDGAGRGGSDCSGRGFSNIHSEESGYISNTGYGYGRGGGIEESEFGEGESWEIS